MDTGASKNPSGNMRAEQDSGGDTSRMGFFFSETRMLALPAPRPNGAERELHPAAVPRPAHLPEAGTPAPDFRLQSTPDQAIALSELRGSPVILAFYPADWSPVCGDQMVLYNEVLPEFSRHGASLLGISVDGIWCHLAFSKDRHLRFPLLADFEPKGAVARSYGAYREQDGICERALFVLDGDGIIRWSHVSPLGINPGADGILTALESLHPSRVTA